MVSVLVAYLRLGLVRVRVGVKIRARVRAIDKG